MSGYLISTDESDFKDSIICSSDGTNQGPLNVYLKNKNNKGITGAITVAEKRDGQINIDKTKPTATITYEENSIRMPIMNLARIALIMKLYFL